MNRRPEMPGDYRVFPEHAEPCVWMVSGFLSYRLCDRDFDCESCPLDAAIHGAHTAAPPGVTETPEGPPEWGIRDGFAYHPIYGWVADEGGRLRWGLDGFSARLLDHLTEVVVPPVGSQAVQGKVACWARDDGELVPLRSPLTGRVARSNPAVARDPALVIHDPYGEGWLIEVERIEGLSGQPGLCDSDERRRHTVRQRRRLHKEAMLYLHRDQGLGPTAPDGGEPLPSLRRMLGRERYHRLVFALLR